MFKIESADLVISLVLFAMLKPYSASANQDALLFPISSNSNLTKNDFNYDYNDNLASPVVTTKPPSILIKPVNNNTDHDNKKPGWRWSEFEENQRRHQEEERKRNEENARRREEEIELLDSRKKSEANGRMFWTVFIIVIVVLMVVVIFAATQARSCVFALFDCSSPQNVVRANNHRPSAPAEHTLNNGNGITVQEEERHFFPNVQPQQSQDVPPPYPGPRPIPSVQELSTPTSPPPSYSSGWVKLNDRNNAQFSKA